MMNGSIQNEIEVTIFISDYNYCNLIDGLRQYDELGRTGGKESKRQTITRRSVSKLTGAVRRGVVAGWANGLAVGVGVGSGLFIHSLMTLFLMFYHHCHHNER